MWFPPLCRAVPDTCATLDSAAREPMWTHIRQAATKREAARKRASLFCRFLLPLVRFSVFDSFIPQVVLRRTVVRTAYHRLHTGILHLRNQTQRTAMRTRQHGYVWVGSLAHRSRVLQQKQGSRFHLLWNPLSKQFKLRQHAIPPVRSC